MDLGSTQPDEERQIPLMSFRLQETLLMHDSDMWPGVFFLSNEGKKKVKHQLLLMTGVQTSEINPTVDG